MEASADNDPDDEFRKYLESLMNCLLAPISTGTFRLHLEDYCQYADATITDVLIAAPICSVRCVNLAMGAGA